MDALGRVTQIAELVPGQHYFQLKGGQYYGRMRFVRMDENDAAIFANPSGAEVHTIGWRERYIPAWRVAANATRPRPMAERITSKVGLQQVYQWIRSRVRRRPGQMCGNCQFYDYSIRMCFHPANADVIGDCSQNIEPMWWCCNWTVSLRAF